MTIERLTAEELADLILDYERHPNDGVCGPLLGKLLDAARENERLRELRMSDAMFICDLEEKIGRLRAALQFYADERNWDGSMIRGRTISESPIEKDEGNIARAVLIKEGGGV